MNNGKILAIGTVCTAIVAFVLFGTDLMTPEQEVNVTPVLAAADVIVYKSPTCGCCTEWAKHMEENDFTVDERPTNDMYDVKARAGITPELSSCHTAFVDGYVVEGHVPAKDIERLLADRPEAVGLTVPAMPVGSPGMEVEGVEADSYDVLLINKDGSTSIWASY